MVRRRSTVRFCLMAQTTYIAPVWCFLCISDWIKTIFNGDQKIDSYLRKFIKPQTNPLSNPSSIESDIFLSDTNGYLNSTAGGADSAMHREHPKQDQVLHAL
jgi:hypothetical protein